MKFLLSSAFGVGAEPQNYGNSNTMSLRFSSKRGGQNKFKDFLSTNENKKKLIIVTS